VNNPQRRSDLRRSLALTELLLSMGGSLAYFYYNREPHWVAFGATFTLIFGGQFAGLILCAPKGMLDAVAQRGSNYFSGSTRNKREC